MVKWGPARKGVAQLVGVNSAVQVVGVLALALIARLYRQEDYGAFAALMASAALLGPIACLKYERVVLLAATPRALSNAVGLSLMSILVVSVGTGLISALVASREWWSYPLSIYWLVPVVLSQGFFLLASQFALREKHYSRVAAARLYQGVITPAGQVGAGLAPSIGAAGLILGYIGGAIAAVLALARGVAHRPTTKPALIDIRALALKYWRFPLVFTPSAIFNGLGSNLTLLALTYAFGAAAAAPYAVAQRLLHGPVLVIANSVAQVNMSEMAARIRMGESASDHYLRASRSLLLVAGFIAAVLMTPIVDLASTLVAPQWSGIASYVRASAVGVLPALIVTPLSSVYPLFQAARLSILVDVTRPVLVISGILLVRLWMDSPLGLVLGGSSGYAISQLLSWFIGLRIVRRGGHLT